jgi:tetraacyldisaccharide 4'-kinase
MIATWWGEGRHPLWVALRLPLIPFSLPYGAAAALRRTAYRRGWLRAITLPVPAISIGNLTVGGTGKTPMVRWVAERILAAGRRPLVFSSGFGARADGSTLDEEGASLKRALPGVPIRQGRDAPRLLLEACSSPERPDAIVLDDGFQKLAIRRDLDLVMLDATRPFGTGLAVPAGPLREWPAALAAAGVIVLSRVDLAGPDRGLALKRRVEARVPGVPVLRQRHDATRLVRSGAPAADLRGLGVHLISAIAHPRAFEETVRRTGARVLGHDAFMDHAPLPGRVVERALARARDEGADLLLASAKDAPKLEAWRDCSPRVDALDITVVFEDDPAPLVDRLEALLGRPLNAEAHRS